MSSCVAIKQKVKPSQHQPLLQEPHPSKPRPSQPRPSPAETAFNELQNSMKALLSGSISSLATKCWAKGLIAGEMYSDIFDHNYGSTQKRVDYFLLQIVKKVESYEQNRESERARNVIQQLADIVGLDSALSSLAQEIGMSQT